MIVWFAGPRLPALTKRNSWPPGLAGSRQGYWGSGVRQHSLSAAALRQRYLDGSLVVAQRSYFRRLSPRASHRCLWAQRAEPMRPSLLHDSRSLLGQLSRVAAWSRPEISASLGEIRERAGNLIKLKLFTNNRLAPYVHDTANLHSLKFLSTVGVARLPFGVVADGPIGKLTKEKREKPRAGWPGFSGDGLPVGSYHNLGREPEKLRQVTRSSIAREVLAMAQGSEPVQELSSDLGHIIKRQKSGPLRPTIVSACFLIWARGRPLAKNVSSANIWT